MELKGAKLCEHEDCYSAYTFKYVTSKLGPSVDLNGCFIIQNKGFQSVVISDNGKENLFNLSGIRKAKLVLNLNRHLKHYYNGKVLICLAPSILVSSIHV